MTKNISIEKTSRVRVVVFLFPAIVNVVAIFLANIDSSFIWALIVFCDFVALAGICFVMRMERKTEDMDERDEEIYAIASARGTRIASLIALLFGLFFNIMSIKEGIHLSNKQLGLLFNAFAFLIPGIRELTFLHMEKEDE